MLVNVIGSGINENENNFQFSFYPNPARHSITIQTKLTTSINIYNMFGETVISEMVQDKSIIDVSELANGMYFIQTKEGYILKLMKQ